MLSVKFMGFGQRTKSPAALQSTIAQTLTATPHSVSTAATRPPVYAPRRLPGTVKLPVIIPPSPELPPPPRTESKSNLWLYIGGILALYFLADSGSGPHRKQRSSKRQDVRRFDGLGSELEGCRDKQGKFIPIPRCINKPSALLKEDTPKTKTEELRRKIHMVVTAVKPETITQLSKRFEIPKREMEEIVSSMAEEEEINVRLQRGSSPLVVPPDYAAQLKDYERAILHRVSAKPGLTEGEMLREAFVDPVFLTQALLDMRSDKLIKTDKGLEIPGPHKITLTAKGKKQLALSGQLSGDVENCAAWIPDDYGGYKCAGYARVCKPPACESPLDTTTKQIKVCTTTQRVYSPFYKREIERCKKYKAACKGGACMIEPMPYPGTPPERTVPEQDETRSLAQWMAEEYNRETFEKEPYLAREILSRGGIRPYRKGHEKEEYRGIPLFLKNRNGMPLDEIAGEMGYDYTNDLMEDIALAYPPKAKGAWKKLKRKTWEDFENAAYEMIEEGMEAGTWSGLGADLFPGLKRELVLKTEDIAMSDDPLEIFLQRKGWDMSRVNELQASIAEKAVPDMFTNKTVPLSVGEKELQRTIQEFFDKSKPAKKAKKKPKPKIDPFWIVEPVQQNLFGVNAR